MQDKLQFLAHFYPAPQQTILVFNIFLPFQRRYIFHSLLTFLHLHTNQSTKREFHFKEHQIIITLKCPQYYKCVKVLKSEIRKVIRFSEKNLEAITTSQKCLEKMKYFERVFSFRDVKWMKKNDSVENVYSLADHCCRKDWIKLTRKIFLVSGTKPLPPPCGLFYFLVENLRLRSPFHIWITFCAQSVINFQVNLKLN